MDVFQDQATNKRRALLNALRYHAHVNGASIIAISRKDKTQLNFLRGILNHYSFGNPFKSTTILESSKSIVVPAGSDSFEAIGLPGGCDSIETSIEMSTEKRNNAWKQTAEEFFEAPAPATENDDPDANEAHDDLNLSPEPVVDAMVKQKEEELAKYRKEAERKRRLAAKEPKKRSKR
jgi:dynein light intermediate chain 2